ncbi:metallophosphoesterase [Methylobacterium sp. Leaf102]|jgi:calcineurin-like phosphoesterase family protein|uniref:Uncharacterized protein n=2 Tax=Methylobacterium TaxID=407 RepID=A0A679J9I8_9HYPH|nr:MULTISPECIES: metallophosphoesterase [Methylobacterium]GJE17200.1 hypothetical protein AIGOOFII_1913 [Methylobacterium marchantiae]KQP18572.1 metallophosphoesterase [Methylobacterium sp. Leaf100]KQP23913.1 metallophosphoesterase [Methylobacterium sp. Leaf102]MBD8903063.1 metallophosphoesterase [Methylobacterium bullatum]CAA2104576.1 hypothetical protein MBUL_02772 [Methylobacterium bullatum]
MPKVHFTADSHVGHQALILSPRMQTQRPFASLHEHDETLVERWNAVVHPDDTVWHLGDFAYRCTETYALAIFLRLNGRKLLIRGNHERIGERLPWAEPVRDVAMIALPDPAGVMRSIWLSHYPHVSYPRSHRGGLHLHGHSHGSVPGTATRADVGVDCWDWAPVTLDRILARLATNGAGS